MSSSSEEDQSSVARHRSSKPSGAQPSGAVSDQDLPQHDPDPPYSTLKRSTLLGAFFPSLTPESLCLGPQLQSWVWTMRKAIKSSILPLSSVIKDAFDKFQHDFKAANLPEGKYIKPPSTSKWYRVGQPCYQDKYQELSTDFAKICITPKPSGAHMGKVPLPILKKRIGASG